MTRAPLFGPRLAAGGGFEFSLWAPAAKHVDLVGAQIAPMLGDGDGWFRLIVPESNAGFQYRFRIDDELVVADPASAFQPEDVFGPSEVVIHDYAWQSDDWHGRSWREATILELHVGTFTPEGTYRAAIEHLGAIRDTGFTAIELMPIADFPGRWNWGYDGVLWYAPDSAYGRPDDLKSLIDAAHQRGLMVFLDVVYNHFGPEGNYLARYAPDFFAKGTHTPWGAAIDYRVPEVRAFAIESALNWIANYRFDGLRLDAVHAVTERGEPSILHDISVAVGEVAQQTGREIHLVLENDGNEAGLLDPGPGPAAGKFRAQWNDDYHHAWHVLLTGERDGYYKDYAADPVGNIARILKSGFAYQGEKSIHRGDVPRGEPSGHLAPTAFVSFLQNHDQIGNRAFGERLDALADPAKVEAALAVMLLSPMPPMMFMGEAWGETRPFHYFCDFTGELAVAVREGRRREFKDAYAAQSANVPDPMSAEVVWQSKIDWSDLNKPAHVRRRDLVKRLFACRAQYVVPRLTKLDNCSADASVEDNLLEAWWKLSGGTLRLRANLGESALPVVPLPGRAIWGEQGSVISPWSVVWTWED